MTILVITLVLTCVSCLTLAAVSPRNLQAFIDYEVVPDVLNSPPAQLLSVTFPNGVEALTGNKLTIAEVTGVPTLGWSADPERFYTLIFCDADAPSRAKPEARSFLHWLVVNIPGDDVTAGETLTNILNSHPEPGTGLHRYIFLVYEQPANIVFEEQIDDTFERRVNFYPEDFSDKYNLGTPVAGNFYQTVNLED